MAIRQTLLTVFAVAFNSSRSNENVDLRLGSDDREGEAPPEPKSTATRVDSMERAELSPPCAAYCCCPLSLKQIPMVRIVHDVISRSLCQRSDRHVGVDPQSSWNHRSVRHIQTVVNGRLPRLTIVKASS